MADDIPTWKTFTEGDTDATLYFALTDEDNAALDLTGKTVTLEGLKRGGTPAFTPIAATVTGAAAGQGYAPCTTLSAAAGEYRCQLRVTTSGVYFRSYPGKIIVRGAAAAGLS